MLLESEAQNGISAMFLQKNRFLSGFAQKNLIGCLTRRIRFLKKNPMRLRKFVDFIKLLLFHCVKKGHPKHDFFFANFGSSK